MTGFVAKGSKSMARILVVDDDAAVRSAISSWVTSDGHEVVECATLADAYAMLPGCPADVIMLDLSLVLGTSENDVVMAFRKIASQTTLLMMSGMTSGDVHAQNIAAPQARRVMFLQKPFRPADLSHAIDSLTRQEPGGKTPG